MDQLTGPPRPKQEEVRLIARSGAGQIGVRFLVTPELNESRTVNYEEIADIRKAGGISIYIGTPGRTYQLNARMVSRTRKEASETFRSTHLLKSWCMPLEKNGFNATNASTDPSAGGSVTGTGDNSPEILRLYGYGQTRQFRGVPTVITSLGIDFPENVTYIQTEQKNAYVPIIQTFSISLKEVRTVGQLEGFDIEAFKQGILSYW